MVSLNGGIWIKICFFEINLCSQIVCLLKVQLHQGNNKIFLKLIEPGIFFHFPYINVTFWLSNSDTNWYVEHTVTVKPLRLSQVCREMNRSAIKILSLNEVRWKNSGRLVTREYNIFLYSGSLSESQKRGCNYCKIQLQKLPD